MIDESVGDVTLSRYRYVTQVRGVERGYCGTVGLSLCVCLHVFPHGSVSLYSHAIGQKD